MPTITPAAAPLGYEERRPEVGDGSSASGASEDIGRLEIAMDRAGYVGRVVRFGARCGPSKCFRRLQLAALRSIDGNELSDDSDVVSLVLDHVKHRDDAE